MPEPFTSTQHGLAALSALDVAWMSVHEAGGRLLLGFGLGYLGFWSVRFIDQYGIEVLMTLAIVMDVYTLARWALAGAGNGCSRHHHWQKSPRGRGERCNA